MGAFDTLNSHQMAVVSLTAVEDATPKWNFPPVGVPSVEMLLHCHECRGYRGTLHAIARWEFSIRHCAERDSPYALCANRGVLAPNPISVRTSLKIVASN
jgi:hypothetical protein